MDKKLPFIKKADSALLKLAATADVKTAVSYGFAAVRGQYGNRIVVNGLSASQILKYIYESLLCGRCDDLKFAEAVSDDTIDDFIHKACADCSTWYYTRWCELRLVVGPTCKTIIGFNTKQIKDFYYGTPGITQCDFCYKRNDKHQKCCERRIVQPKTNINQDPT